MNVWNDRYLAGRYPWDIGRASPLLIRVVDELFCPPAKIIVPGCGQGWEIDALLQRGFDVTGFDIAPAALELVSGRLGKTQNLSLQTGDILNIPGSLRCQYDMLIEHTCFCSISPTKWDDYVTSVAALLVPGGKFVGAFLNFDNQEADGPPFGIDSDRIRDLFSTRFEIQRLILAPECFPPADVELPPQIYRVAQLEAIFQKRQPDLYSNK